MNTTRTKKIAAIVAMFVLLPLSLAAQNVRYLLPMDNQFVRISNFSDSLARVYFAYDSVGFINTRGKQAFPQTFKAAGNFHSGMAWVQKEVSGSYKYGFIDTTGAVVIPYIYDKVKDFSCNRAAVKKDSSWYIIDRGGNVIMGDSLLLTKQMVISIPEGGGHYEPIPPPSFHSHRLAIYEGGKHGYVNTSGEIVIPLKYDVGIGFSDGVALVANEVPYKKRTGGSFLDSLYNSLPDGPPNYQWMVIDTTGNVLYTFKKNQDPEWLIGFSNGIIQFLVGRKMGFINKHGKVIIPPIYGNSPYPFAYSNGVCIVQVRGQRSDNKDGYMLLYDRKGTIVSKIPFTSDVGTMYDSNHQYHEGLLGVKIDRKDHGMKWGYIDKQGNFIIPPMFDLALDFHDGRAVVKTKNGRVNYLVNPLEKS